MIMKRGRTFRAAALGAREAQRARAVAAAGGVLIVAHLRALVHAQRRRLVEPPPRRAVAHVTAPDISHKHRAFTLHTENTNTCCFVSEC
jgi:hypothetical protein